jgi:ATP-binding cassette subfamily B protein
MSHARRQRHRAWQFVRQILAPYYWYIGGMIFISMIWAIDQSLRPYLIKMLIDGLQGISLGKTFMGRVVFLAGLYLFCSFLVVASFRLYDWMVLRMMPSLKQRITHALHEYLMKHDYHFYQTHLCGSLSIKLSDIVDGVPDLIEIIVERALSNGMALFIAIGTMWSVHASFAVTTACWVLLFMIGVGIMAPRQRDLADKASDARAVASGNLVDVCNNMMAVRLFCGKQHETTRLDHILDQWVRAERKRAWSALALYIFQGTSYVIFEGICLWLLLAGFARGEITSGDFALIFSLNMSLLYILWRTAQDITRFSKILGSVTQGLRTIFVPHRVVDDAHATVLHVERGEIVFDRVSFCHSDGKPLFSDLSVKIEAGQKVGLVGYSGSGKTTFVNLILRLFDVTSGHIYVDGQDIAHVTQDSLHAAISFIPQDPALFHRSIEENIRYGKLNADNADMVRASHEAHAHEFIMKIPAGYDALVGERGARLSGGQRQRIAIARVMLKKTNILIFDEATSALDSLTESLIQESLTQAMKDHTAIVIAHRLATLLHMDRILVFNNGEIVEDGSHMELMEQKGLYAQLWSAQVCGLLPEECDETAIVV